MDLNKDAKLTFEEFKEGSKLDPTIVQVSDIFAVTVTDTDNRDRPCHYMTVWSRVIYSSWQKRKCTDIPVCRIYPSVRKRQIANEVW